MPSIDPYEILPAPVVEIRPIQGQPLLGAGTGDMTSLVYDPGGVADDAFDLSNHSGDLDLGTFL